MVFLVVGRKIRFLCLRFFLFSIDALFVALVTLCRVDVSTTVWAESINKNIHHASSRAVEWAAAGGNSSATEWAPGRCMDAFSSRTHLAIRRCGSSESPSPSKSSSCTSSPSLAASRHQHSPHCLLMKESICRTDARSKTCISASETAKWKRKNRGRENERKEKWLFAIKWRKRGMEESTRISRYSGESHVFVILEWVGWMLGHISQIIE